MALVLSVPGLAAASHKTAAFVWGMSSIEPDTAEIVTVRHRRIHRKNPQIHESKDLEAGDVVGVCGIPTTTAVRTVVDVGASASVRFVEHCLDTGLRMELFNLAEVRSFIKRVARSGRSGVGKIRPLVDQRDAWETASESALEDRFRRLIADSALPAPTPQYQVRAGSAIVCRADFAYPDRRILIELDGERYHMDRATFQRDRVKQNQAHALGWIVYRFTWRQVIDTPEVVVATLASALIAGRSEAFGVADRNMLRSATPE
jgi:very-short-patch-repair endonuclease